MVMLPVDEDQKYLSTAIKDHLITFKKILVPCTFLISEEMVTSSNLPPVKYMIISIIFLLWMTRR